jgi:hypothetical protein
MNANAPGAPGFPPVAGITEDRVREIVREELEVHGVRKPPAKSHGSLMGFMSLDSYPPIISCNDCGKTISDRAGNVDEYDECVPSAPQGGAR